MDQQPGGETSTPPIPRPRESRLAKAADLVVPGLLVGWLVVMLLNKPYSEVGWITWTVLVLVSAVRWVLHVRNDAAGD